MNFRYPIFLDLSGKKCLVAGEGPEIAGQGAEFGGRGCNGDVRQSSC